MHINTCVHVSSKFFSSVTDPRHSCPRQLQKHITMPTRSLPKPYSQIPRFPQPSFPDRPRISVSCSWMADGYPREATHVGVFALELMFLRPFSLSSWLIHRKHKYGRTGPTGSVLAECVLVEPRSSGPSMHQLDMEVATFHRHKISLTYSYT